MAAKAPAKKKALKGQSGKSASPAAAKKAVKPPAKKAAKTAAKAAAKKPPGKPGKPAPRRTRSGAVTFIVQVSDAYLTMEYDGSPSQAYEMVLFVKDEEQARSATEFVRSLGLREIVIGTAKAYSKP